MFYNFSLAPYFILLFVGFAAAFEGLLILKARSFVVPLSGGERVEGAAAERAGYALLAIGALSFVALIWLLLR